MTDIREVAPDDPRLAPLIARHLELMHETTPIESIHAMDAAELASAGVRFFAIFEGVDAVAMGALKALPGGGGEVKSMHVRSDRRGGGLADAVLECVLDAAREAGMARVSLETGSQDEFAPARAFYARHGFAYCPPFEGYIEDPNSVFMMREL